MSTYIQDQHDVLKFWIRLYENAITLRKKIDSLYNFQRDLTEHEHKIYYSIFQHSHSLMRVTENHEKLILHMGTEIPAFEFVCQAKQRFINTISCILKQITNIKSSFIESYGNECEFTKLEKNTIYIMNCQKEILQSRLRKEQNICSACDSLQFPQNKVR